MKVRLKIKHLVTVVVAIASFLLIFSLLVQPMLENQFIDKQIASGNIDEAKAAIIEKIEKSHFNQLELIKEYMIEPQPFGESRIHYDVYIGFSMSSGSGNLSTTRIFTLEEIEPYLRMYLEEAPTDGYFRRTVEILKTHYENSGNIPAAEAVVTESIKRFRNDDYNYHELQLILIELVIENGDYQKADLLIAKYKPTMNKRFIDAHLRLSNLRAELLVKQEKYQEANQFLAEEISEYKDWNQDLIADMREGGDSQVDGLRGSPYYNALVQMHNRLKRILDEPESLATIEGRIIRSNGEPIANAGVFLLKENQVSRSIIEGDTQTVTAPDGSFSFTGELPGSYQIRVGFMFEQIDGWAWPVEYDDWIEISAGETVEYPIKITPLIETVHPANYDVIRDQEVTFAWESFPNAASYELTGNIIVNNGSIGFQLLSGITENEVTIAVEDLYQKRTGTMFRGDDFTDVEPGSILGFANTEGTFSWSIRALNEAGKLIGQSNGYRLREETMGSVPFFHLKARELTKADQEFLDDGNVETALATYKKSLENDPNDVHSLRMVTRLIGIDYESDGRALPYLLALAKQSPTEDTLFKIARHYYQQENWSEFDDWYQRHNKAVDNKPNYYIKSFYAGSLMKQGQLAEARSIFYEVVEEDRSNGFIGIILALELYLQDDWSKVNNLASQFKERGHDSVDWPYVLSRLKDKVTNTELRPALEMFFTGDKVEIENFVTQTQNKTLGNYIKLLSEVH